MPAAPIAWFREQFFDTNGDPLSSGSLEFFESGTSTPLAVYSDADLNTSAGTTVTLNSAGFPQVNGTEVTLFPLPRAYRVVVKNSSGTTLRTIDGVYALSTASSSNLDISDAVAGEGLSAGDLCYLSDGSNSLTAGRWYRADSDFYYASIHPELGFATAAITSGGTGTIRIGGVMTGLSGLTAGTTYFASATAGALTATAPTNARSVGVAISTTTLRIDIAPQWLPNESNLKCQGRLTLTTATPVTTADVTGATSVYFTPYGGNRVDLFDGSKWKTYPFTEITGALGTLTSGANYDVFLYDNAGTLTLEYTAWTNDTTRATALTTQNGRYVKTGATTRLYLGTFRTTSTTATEDSVLKRFLWNYYNRAPRTLQVVDATNSWTYTTAAYQQANASAANQVDVVIGVAEVTVSLTVQANFSNTNASVTATVGVGYDSTSSAIAGIHNAMQSDAINTQRITTAIVHHYPAAGRHYYAWLEYSAAVGTTSWYGDNGGVLIQSGMNGVLSGG